MNNLSVRLSSILIKDMCRLSLLHSFISETESLEEQITRFAQLRGSLAKRLGTISPSACDQRFNTQVTHCVSQIQKDVQMSCMLNRSRIIGVLQCNRASLWKEQGGDAASRDVEVRIRRRLVFFWDKPRGGTKKNKKISNGLERSPSQPPPLYTRVCFILFLWIMLLRVTAVPKLPPKKKKNSSSSIFLFADASYQQQATTTDTLESTFAALAPSQQTWIFRLHLSPRTSVTGWFRNNNALL